MHLAILVNPAARSGVPTDVADRAARRLRDRGVQVSLISGGSAAESTQLLRAALAAGAEAVAVVGGDGTVSLAIEVLVGTSVPLGVIPAGTGNDFATSIGLPEFDTDAAADAIASGCSRTIDIARAHCTDGSSRAYGTILATGFDSKVNDRANKMRWPRGRSRYNIAILIEFLLLKSVPYHLEWELEDGTVEVHDGSLLMAAIANGRTYGGGIPIAPGAVMDDGLLDLVMVRPAGRLSLLRLLGKVYRAAHEAEPIVEIQRVRRVRVDAAGLTGYADGDRLGTLPLEVSIEPGALTVFAPPSASV